MAQDANLQYRLVHDKETIYFILCLIISVFGYLTLLFTFFGIFIVIFMVLFSLFFHALSMASIRRNGVRVSEQQFPEVYEKAQSLAAKMGLEKMPQIYVIEYFGVLNAFATRFFGRNMVVIFSEIFELKDEEREDELLFVLAHEFAHLKRRHVSLHLLLLPTSFVPLLREAYMRACEYTCDRYAAYYVNNFEASKKALTMLAIGKSLASKVNEEAYIRQINEESGFFAWLSEKLSTHPDLPKRINSLNHWRNPGQYRLVPENTSKIVLGIVISIVLFFISIGIITAIGVGFSKFAQFLDLEGSALKTAVIEDDLSKMEYLINSNANLEERDIDGMTPLQNAIILENSAAVEILLENGADVNTVDNWGYTPLLNAVFYEVDPEIVELLLQYGADPYLVNDDGRNSFDYAIQYDLYEYMELLEQYARY